MSSLAYEVNMLNHIHGGHPRAKPDVEANAIRIFNGLVDAEKEQKPKKKRKLKGTA